MILPILMLVPGPSGAQHAAHSSKGAAVTVITNGYTYPTAISENGQHVVGMLFGGVASYYWSAGTGIVQIPGTINGVANGGISAGDYQNSSVTYNGNNVTTAGTWSPSTLQWTFLGMNPVVPNTFATDYNTGWDITADASTVVGMQWYPNYDYSAYKWTSAGGYTMIGNGVGSGSRASGVSSNGTAVFGWAEVPAASRTPVIWNSGQVIYVNNMQSGEAFGASTTGNYVTGQLGSNGFLWSPQGTVLFSNTLTSGNIVPTTVLNDGTTFGYTISWPPVPNQRRAFARDAAGNLTTFNDYAEARGMTDAQLWVFYSINDADGTGNKLIGAGVNPQGQDVTFLLEFYADIPLFTAYPSSLAFGDQLVATISDYEEVGITNSGTGNLLISSLSLAGQNNSQFILQDANNYPLSLAAGDTAWISVAFAPVSGGAKSAHVAVATNAGNQQVPLTGTGVYPVGISGDSPTSTRLFPLPARDRITITHHTAIEKAELFTLQGKSLSTWHGEGKNVLTIFLTKIDVGSYLLQCTGIDGSIKTHTIPVIK